MTVAGVDTSITRQVDGLHALENAASVDADLAIHLRNVGP
jgi:hypothetical protein